MSSNQLFSISNREHMEIVQLGIKLGYFANDLGACRGITLAWISACLTSEKAEDKFLYFTKKITDEGLVIYDKIIEMQGKFSRKEKLSEDEKELFQYLAFYEQISLYLNPDEYTKFFDKKLTQVDIENISMLANSELLEKKGGISLIYSEPGIYTKNEIQSYLEALAQSLNVYEGTIAICLGSCNHTIGLTYNTKNHRWRFLDINYGKPEELAVDAISEKIIKCFNIPRHTPIKEYTAFTTQVIIGDDPLKHQSSFLKSYLQKFKDTYRTECPFEIIAKRKGEASLILIAASIGDNNIVKKCIEVNADVNSATSKGITPLYIAAQNGNVEVITTLLNAKEIQIDKIDSNGHSPLCVAAMFGHIDAVKALLDKGADPNLEKCSPPLYLASLFDRIDVVRLLLARGANPNITNPEDGETPFSIASEFDIKKALLEAGAHDLIDGSSHGIK